MSTIDTFAEDLHGYLAPEQVAQVVRAYDFAEEAHEGQTRKSGEPYINHPLAVAQILADMRVDHQCLMAALLHDVIEDLRSPSIPSQLMLPQTWKFFFNRYVKAAPAEAQRDPLGAQA